MKNSSTEPDSPTIHSEAEPIGTGAQAQAQLAAIVTSCEDAIVSKTLNGIITTWNAGAERTLGYAPEEIIGQSILRLIPPELHDEEERIITRIRAGQRIEHYETERLTKEGHRIPVSLTISPIKDTSGNIIGASKIARDITERKRSEEAIRLLNAQLSADLSAMARMQEISTRLVQAEDFSQLLDEIVAAGAEITGADMGNIQLFRGDVLQIVSHRGFDAPFLEFFNRVSHGSAACGTALERGERVIVEDVRQSPIFIGTPALDVMLAAGAIAVQSTPLISRSGTPLGMFSTHYRTPRRPADRELRMLDLLARQAADLIERTQAEAARRATAKNLERITDDLKHFAYAASHDLQEPLRMVTIYAQLLVKDCKGQLGERADQYIDYTVQGAHRMETLLKGMRDYWQASERGEHHSIPTDTNAALEQALLNLQESITTSGAIITHDPLPVVPADETAFVQVFQNLIGNAIKYRGDEMPRVHISAARNNGEWTFSVKDNGIGIDPQFAEKVFVVFNRLNGNKYPGSGIGLSLCRKVIEHLGGTIWVESSIGQGSTFKFTIPCED